MKDDMGTNARELTGEEKALVRDYLVATGTWVYCVNQISHFYTPEYVDRATKFFDKEGGTGNRGCLMFVAAILAITFAYLMYDAARSQFKNRTRPKTEKVIQNHGAQLRLTQAQINNAMRSAKSYTK